MTRLLPIAALLLAGCELSPDLGGPCRDWVGGANDLYTKSVSCRPDQVMRRFGFGQFECTCLAHVTDGGTQ